VLVYSVCTISAAESGQVVDRLLAEHPELDLELERTVQLLPHRDGTDGFFIARMRRPAR
jgi:16S rRNA (cytosine967-C5)-methyltransferase